MKTVQHSIPGWMAQNLKIVDMDGQVQSLYLNVAQRMIHKTIETVQLAKGCPVRIIVLKARREGVSTYAEGRFFYEINLRPNVNAVVVSADLESTNKVFRMAKRFQQHMPKHLTKNTDYSNRKEIVYSEPHGSAFIAQTAGTDVLGRGGQSHYFHGTELAHWKDAKAQLGGALQEVPDKNSMVILESTANGIGGAFHDMYWQAVEDWKFSKNPANYLPIFLPWFIFPDYQMAIPEGVDFKVGIPDGNIPYEWVEIEDEMTKKYGLCKEQLFWRRWAIKNKCQNDLELFHQEYPYCSQIAFSASGRNVFLASKVAEVECKEGIRCILIDDNGIRPEVVVRSMDCWQVWRKPQPGCEYTIGIDTMEGTQADPDDPKSNYDLHAVSVFCRDTGEIVAVYLGRGSQRDLGNQCKLVQKWYNDAWIAPELPFGMVVLDVLKEAGIDRIYQRQKADEQRVESDSLNLGWRTTIITRPKMVDNFRTAFHEGEIKFWSADLVDEMKTFVYNKEGRPKHRPGKHDDLLFASMIALQIHLRLPFRPAPYPHATTHDGEETEHKLSLSMAGAKDSWEPFDEDDYDEEYTE